MTTKSDFTQEEWARIVRAPFVAGMAVSLVDPGDSKETTKETMATLATATNPPTGEELLAEVAAEVDVLRQNRESPLGGYRPSAEAGSAAEQVLEELRAVQAIVAAKAAPGETAAFAGWLVSAAQAAAGAAKEGGFLGFGGQQVSDREQEMLDRVREVVGG
ncbi:MAG TPA: hypothetical protein VFX33_15130 [Actinomycetales bacterium]|nr:hypothetical protein [Actinomycetales bacterium]